MREFVDRRALKAESRALLADAQVSPKAMVALYLGLTLLLNLVYQLSGTSGLLSTFVYILTSLMALVLQAGFILYCMAVRRGERAELLTLFDGFSFAGKVILLKLAIFCLVAAWSLLFLIPGVIAAYRYRFALPNLCENPELGVMEALALSRRQSFGFKWPLFLLDLSYLGWSLLASLPVLFYQSFIAHGIIQNSVGQFVGGTAGIAASLASLPALFWVLFAGLWQLGVSLFYYAQFQCTELGYFELARQAARAPGPDGLGGL